MIDLLEGDIWSYWGGARSWVVIPTNIGYRHDGTAVMGAGLALQAATRFAGLREEYGRHCRGPRCRMPYVTVPRHLILVPTKPLDEKCPSRSWRQPADIGMVSSGTGWVAGYLVGSTAPHSVYLPLLGGGLGGLGRHTVLRTMAQAIHKHYFSGVGTAGNVRFYIVLQKVSTADRLAVAL